MRLPPVAFSSGPGSSRYRRAFIAIARGGCYYTRREKALEKNHDSIQVPMSSERHCGIFLLLALTHSSWGKQKALKMSPS